MNVMETFLFTKDIKDIRDSFFDHGFAIPVGLQKNLSLNLRGGRLRHGEKRTIKIFIGGLSFDVTLRSVGFNRERFPTHSEIWQINWYANADISKKLKKIFAKSYNDANEEYESFVLYATGVKDTFCMEPIISREIFIPKMSELALENLLELSQLTGEAAALLERCNLMNIYKLNLNLSEQLKRNYNYRCQICGRNVGENYGAQIADCHHINYFSVSLDNDAKNLLIVCPNHHRIIHAMNPTFDRERKLFLFPNGHEESLKLNDHL